MAAAAAATPPRGRQSRPRRADALSGRSSPSSASPSPHASRSPAAGKNLYKTQLCWHFKSPAGCSKGDRCTYAHGEDDLRPRRRGPPPAEVKSEEGGKEELPLDDTAVAVHLLAHYSLPDLHLPDDTPASIDRWTNKAADGLRKRVRRAHRNVSAGRCRCKHIDINPPDFEALGPSRCTIISGSELGFGSGSTTVFLGIMHSTSLVVAVKRVESKSSEELDLLEERTMKMASTRGAVPVYGVCRERAPDAPEGLDAAPVDTLYIVQQVQLGTFHDIMQVLHDDHDDDDVAKQWLMRSACTALASMHASGVVHRDVHEGNILIGWDGAAHMCDLDLSRMTEPSGRVASTIVHGQHLRPPEEQVERIIASHSRHGPFAQPTMAGDVYMLGQVLWQLWFNEHPYSCDRHEAFTKGTLCGMGMLEEGAESKLRKVFKRADRSNPMKLFCPPKEPGKIVFGLQWLLVWMIQPHPSDRPSMRAVLAYPDDRSSCHGLIEWLANGACRRERPSAELLDLPFIPLSTPIALDIPLPWLAHPALQTYVSSLDWKPMFPAADLRDVLGREPLDCGGPVGKLLAVLQALCKRNIRCLESPSLRDLLGLFLRAAHRFGAELPAALTKR
eukprot:PLAT9038.7.p1 GENE.PLAT9038.7~~PLAT9038.7.p1  ORF type:complete len:616 (+),score=104.01 PLAT9038.7:87-1934(+)